MRKKFPSTSTLYQTTHLGILYDVSKATNDHTSLIYANYTKYTPTPTPKTKNMMLVLCQESVQTKCYLNISSN